MIKFFYYFFWPYFKVLEWFVKAFTLFMSKHFNDYD